MKTLIIGGVAGGASCAARLRRLDEKAEIVILERGEFISFANCGLPYYIGGEITEKSNLTLQTPESFKARFNIEVRTFSEAVAIDTENKTVTVKDLKTGEEYAEQYDSLVLSPGASPIRPKIDGIDSDRVFTLGTAYSHMNNPMAGRTKSVQNYISATYPDGHTETLFTPLDPFETPEALEAICNEYNRVIGNMELEPLIAIPTFIHDFLCIHPFNDGNGRMSRLLTTLLLYRNGFYVGKYISLEAKIAKNKDLYYDALGQSQQGWHEGEADAVPFIKYLLGTILAAYRDFEDRFALVETKLSSLEMVRRATMNKIGRFKKQDIMELCPSLSISSVEGALRKLVAEGELAREGNGKNICYYRLK